VKITTSPSRKETPTAPCLMTNSLGSIFLLRQDGKLIILYNAATPEIGGQYNLGGIVDPGISVLEPFHGVLTLENS